MPSSEKKFESELFELLEELRPFALAYYHPLVSGETDSPEKVEQWFRRFFIRDFGVGVARAYVKCPHLEPRRFLAENLFEEEGRGNANETHPALSLRLARHFGASEEEIQRTHDKWMKSPAIAQYLELAASYDWLEDFAGFGLGQEFFAPPLFELIVERLRAEFDLDDETLKFFLVHMYEDVDHSVRTMKMVTRYADTDESQQKVCSAIRTTVMGLAGRSGGRPASELPAPIVETLRKGARVAGQVIAPT